MKFLIVGLGNIGPEYKNTRHNVGFMVLDRLAALSDVSFVSSRLADKAELKMKGKAIHLIKPTTFMNLSGKSLKYWMNELKIEPQNTLVVVDDIALPFGTLRMKPKGSNAGHNGLKDIEAQLGTTEYPRLKFGVGNDFAKGRQVEYVLGDFSKEQRKDLPLMIEQACDMSIAFALEGIAKAMNMYNK